MGTSKNSISDKLKNIMRQASGKFEEGDKWFPRYTIKGSGDLFCLLTDGKSFVKISRGIDVFIIEESYDYSGKSLIYTYYGDVVLIEQSELIPIGVD